MPDFFSQEVSLKIIGYYGHGNFGDEQYRVSITQLFHEYLTCKYTISFHDCDKIYKETFSDSDIIVIGGGDILNPYFLNKINDVFKTRPNRIIGLSVGLPYTKILVETTLLQIIDHIFIRTTQDINFFNKYFHPERISYIPDVSYLLSKNYEFAKHIYSIKSAEDIDNVQNNIILSKYSKFLKQYKDEKLTTVGYSDISKQISSFKGSYKLIGICLSRHFYNKNYPDEYSKIISGLGEFIIQRIKLESKIVFVPFNTNTTNSSEDDTLIAADVLNYIRSTSSIDIQEHVFDIVHTLTHDQMNDVFELLDLCIPMRFHSVLYCIYNMVPFVSVYSTRKVHNLLLETDWEPRYKLQTNEKLIPIDFDPDELNKQIIKLQKMDEFRQNIYHKLLHINTNLFGKMFFKTISNLIKIILCKDRDRDIKLEPESTNAMKIIQSTYQAITDYSSSLGYSHFREVTDPNIQNIIVSIVSYNLIGLVTSEYNYGMQEKMFDLTKDYNHVSEWLWIINHNADKECKRITDNPNGLFNMEYMDQIDYSGAHRSGWQYVYEHIEFLHNSQSDLLLDLYVDRSFHWNLEANRVLNLVPYRQNWIGFVHHTFDTSFSNYNCHTLLACPEFIESLKTCRALFVLSNYLKDQFQNELSKLGITNVKVFSLVHPTETDVKRFSYRNFYYNQNKRLVHVGGWLRNVYSFYNVTLPTKTKFRYGLFTGNKTTVLYNKRFDNIAKYALRGKNMNNYYPLQPLLDNIRSTLGYTDQIVRSVGPIQNVSVGPIQNVSVGPVQNVSVGPVQNVSVGPVQNVSVGPIQQNCDDVRIHNNWSKHFYQDLENKISNMQFIEYLDNNEYDTLMTENIVFVNLVDASAVNTIIECIVRTTPIVVNRHPAVVELLGRNYPLYFNTDDTMYVQIHDMFTDDKLIRRAHRYLKCLNKRPFYISTFVKTFQKIIIGLRGNVGSKDDN